MSRRFASLLAGLAAVLLPAEALAQGVAPCPAAETAGLTAADAERLAGLETSRLQGLAAALAAPDAAARQTLGGLYANGLAPLSGPLPEGEHACRVLKLGGLLPLTVYQFFACTIEAEAEGYRLTKLTGSQRLSGTLTPAGDGYLYRGALHYADEAPIAYGADAERDQVGCLHKVSAEGESYVLELPAPQFESVFDVLLLVPKS